MADFLLYWVPETANYELKVGRPLNHAASQQLRRVQSGDTLWIVTVFHGELTLLGRLVVDDITDTDEARQRLGTDDLWDADYHAIAVAETEEKLSEINLSNIQGQLRFQSVQGKDRLTVTDGRVRPQQLQTMRLLASQSAVLLQRLWEAYRGAWGGERGEIGDFRGAGFGDSEMNRKVEQAAIAVVTDKLARAGWTVTSVEHDRVGYDLC
jgi:hypothetical protein